MWLVNFDPSKGAEIKKIRPAVAISSDAVGILPIKLIAPITSWQEKFSRNIWLVKISATATNGLRNDSAVDTLQVRS
ncbi:MAG: type II toxin-antitoxin system PemK/MazF family toxin, partial [Thermoleophilia bacterium]